MQKPEGDIYIDDKAFNCNKWIFPYFDSEITQESNNQEFILEGLFLNIWRHLIN